MTMSAAFPDAPATRWQTLGRRDFEVVDGRFTGWSRFIDGHTVDGRWPEWNQQTGDRRDHRRVFPDGRTEMPAAELPPNWLGYVADDAATLGKPQGIDLGTKPDGFIGEDLVVYAAPADGRRAELQRSPGDEPWFGYRLPPGEEHEGLTTFKVAIAHDPS